MAEPRFIVIFGDTGGGGGKYSDLNYSGYFRTIGDWFKDLGDRLYDMATWWEKYLAIFAVPFEKASAICYNIAYRFYVADDEVRRFRQVVKEMRGVAGELVNKMINVETYLSNLGYWLGELQTFKDTIGSRIVNTINDSYLDRWFAKQGDAIFSVMADQLEAVLDRAFKR